MKSRGLETTRRRDSSTGMGLPDLPVCVLRLTPVSLPPPPDFHPAQQACFDCYRDHHPPSSPHHVQTVQCCGGASTLLLLTLGLLSLTQLLEAGPSYPRPHQVSQQSVNCPGLLQFADLDSHFENRSVNTSCWGNFPVIRFYMRSQRTRRSLEYYMTNMDRAPLHLGQKDSDQKISLLSVTDSAKVELIHNSVDTALLTISVIIDPLAYSNLSGLILSMRPHDNAQVILRRYRTNMCICMAPNGLIVSERLVNHTLSDNCAWRLRISRHGVGFEHLIYTDDAIVSANNSNVDCYKPVQPSTSGNLPAGCRITTLSVTSKYGRMVPAPGSLQHLWQPEATWTVYSHRFMPSSKRPTTPSPTKEEHRTDTAYRTQGSMPVTNISALKTQQNHGGDYTGLTPVQIRLGSKLMVGRETPAEDINSLSRAAEETHCLNLLKSLPAIVQQEVVISLHVLHRLQNSYKELARLLQRNGASNQVASVTHLNGQTALETVLSHVLDEWISLMVSRINRKKYTQKRLIILPDPVVPLYRRNHTSNCRMPSAMEERRNRTKMFHDLFLVTHRLARWSSAELRRWLRRPRMSGLFRALRLSIPSVGEVRKAAFVLHRYLQVFSVTNTQEFDRHFSVSGELTHSFLRQINNQTQALMKRAIILKYEELRFWNSDEVQYTPISNSTLQHEIRELSETSSCGGQLFQHWKHQWSVAQQLRQNCLKLNR